MKSNLKNFFIEFYSKTFNKYKGLPIIPKFIHPKSPPILSGVRIFLMQINNFVKINNKMDLGYL